jgi:small subunit ribosomal protein S20
MANSAQARKRARQAVKQRAHNASLRSSLRTAVKRVQKAVVAGDKATAQSIYQESVAVIDRIADKKIIHKNKAAPPQEPPRRTGQGPQRLAFWNRSSAIGNGAQGRRFLFRFVSLYPFLPALGPARRLFSDARAIAVTRYNFGLGVEY